MLGEESSQFPCEMTDKSPNDRGDTLSHRLLTITELTLQLTFGTVIPSSKIPICPSQHMDFTRTW